MKGSFVQDLKSLSAITLGTLGGAIATVTFLTWDATTKVPPSPGMLAVPLVVAARELPVGTTLAAEHLRVVVLPAETVPNGFATSPAQLIGIRVVRAIDRNQAIKQTHLSTEMLKLRHQPALDEP